jgi:hypothetical protein
MRETILRDVVMMFVGSLMTVGVILWTYVPTEDVYAAGFQQGWKQALDISEPADDLEFACAGLWFGKDGPIYWKMRKDDEQRKNAK